LGKIKDFSKISPRQKISGEKRKRYKKVNLKRMDLIKPFFLSLLFKEVSLSPGLSINISFQVTIL